MRYSFALMLISGCLFVATAYCNDEAILPAAENSVFVQPPAPAHTWPAQAPEDAVRAALLGRASELCKQYKLPVLVAGFSDQIPSDAEYRLYQSPVPNEGAVMLGSRFWIGARYYDSDRYLHYVLFRAAAEYFYRRYFDPDHFAWNVEIGAEPMRTAVGIFQESADSAETTWVDAGHVLEPRDEEFRRSLDPQENPTRILQALTRYAFQAIEQRAADEWAVAHYHKIFKEPETGLIRRHVSERERALAWDFSRATSAMTLGERLSFRQTLKYPLQYTRQAGAPAPKPTAVTADRDDAGASDPWLAVQ